MLVVYRVDSNVLMKSNCGPVPGVGDEVLREGITYRVVAVLYYNFGAKDNGIGFRRVNVEMEKQDEMS